MSNFILCERRSVALTSGNGTSSADYSLEDAAAIAGVHPDLLRHYCQVGLLGEERADPEAEPRFDECALYELRRIENFRHQHGVTLGALPLVCRLWREIERLQSEVDLLRGA